MKRTLLLSIIILLCNICCAQSQKGYVKTKGRLDQYGNIQKGRKISGVSISPKGRNVTVTNKNGKFSFIVQDGVYLLQNVQKKGYSLLDPEILGKQYSYSADDLIIVMENIEEKIEEQMFYANKIRSALMKQIAEKEEQIRELKKLNKISEEEYVQSLQNLMQEQSENEELISEMIEAYSKIDYDQLDEFNRKVKELILNGKLSKADSLLRSKGSILDRISKIKEIQLYNQNESQKLKVRQENLHKNIYYEKKQIKDLSNDCYNYYLTYRMKHQLDSAAYYLETRSLLDTTNFQNAWECGKFFFQAKFIDKAYEYFRIATNNSGISTAERCLVLNDLAVCYVYMGKDSLCIETMKECLDLRNNLMKENPSIHKAGTALSIYNYASMNSYYQFKYEDIATVKEYYHQAMSLYNELIDACELFEVSLASVEADYAILLRAEGRFQEAEEYLFKSYNARKKYAEKYPDYYNVNDKDISITDIDRLINTLDTEGFIKTRENMMLLVAATENNADMMTYTLTELTRLSEAQRDWEKSKYYYKLSSQEFEKLLKKDSDKYLPALINIYINQAYLYLDNCSDPDSARVIADKLLATLQNHDSQSSLFNRELTICDAWLLKGRIEKTSSLENAIKCFKKSVETVQKLDTTDYTNLATLVTSYKILAHTYIESGDIKQGILNYRKRINAFNASRVKNETIIRATDVAKIDLARLYLDAGMNSEAIMLFEEAVKDINYHPENFDTLDFIYYTFEYGSALYIDKQYQLAKQVWETALSYYNEELANNSESAQIAEIMRKKINEIKSN